VIYADPSNDITNDVVYNLNRMYKATGGPAPKGSAAAPAAPSNPNPGAPAAAGAAGQPDGN
jgi:hypothetical protein